MCFGCVAVLTSVVPPCIVLFCYAAAALSDTSAHSATTQPPSRMESWSKCEHAAATATELQPQATATELQLALQRGWLLAIVLLRTHCCHHLTVEIAAAITAAAGSSYLACEVVGSLASTQPLRDLHCWHCCIGRHAAAAAAAVSGTVLQPLSSTQPRQRIRLPLACMSPPESAMWF